MIRQATRQDLEFMDSLLANATHKGRMMRELCTPSEDNPHAAAWFITRLCKTLDEDETRLGQIAPIRDWDFVLRTIAFLEGLRLERYNGLIDKSRRMLGTWNAIAHLVWRSQWTKGLPAFMTTGKGGDYVDDGGDNSTPKSLFGRFRFIWDRLPDDARRPTDFAFKRIVCEETDTFITGEAPNEDGGRSGGYVHALVDESAFVPHGESLNRALNPACRRGQLHITTHNGPATIPAWIVKTRPNGWRILVLDWKEHPDLSPDLVETTEAETERYGTHVSPRFREITDSLRNDDIAQEYNHSIERSLRGLIYKEFNARKHVAPGPLEWDPARPVLMGVDYGSSGFGAAVFGQMHGDTLHVIADYELEGAGGAPVHAANEWAALKELAYAGAPSDVLVRGGPDTDTIQTGSGQTIAGYYRNFGFTNIAQAAVRGPGSVDRGISVVAAQLRRDKILISPRCVQLIERLGEYRWPVERGTGRVRATKPAEGDANHIMDALRYLVTEAFPREDAASELDAFSPLDPTKHDRNVIDDWDDDVPWSPAQGLIQRRDAAMAGGYE